MKILLQVLSKLQNIQELSNKMNHFVIFKLQKVKKYISNDFKFLKLILVNMLYSNNLLMPTYKNLKFNLNTIKNIYRNICYIIMGIKYHIPIAVFFINLQLSNFYVIFCSTLKNFLKKKMSYAAKISLMLEIAYGVQDLHDKRICIRSLRPEVIVILSEKNE